MADQIRTAQYFKMQIADKPGELAGMLAPLREAGVNLVAVHAFPGIAAHRSMWCRKIPPLSRTWRRSISGKYRDRKCACWWMAMIAREHWPI